jgi:hypothetical protein
MLVHQHGQYQKQPVLVRGANTREGNIQVCMGAGGNVVGRGTMLQAGFPMRSLDFFNWPNPSNRTMALG